MTIPVGYPIDNAYRLAGFPFGQPSPEPPEEYTETAANSWAILYQMFGPDAADYLIDNDVVSFVQIPNDSMPSAVFDYYLASVLLERAANAGYTPLGRPLETTSVVIGDYVQNFADAQIVREQMVRQARVLRARAVELGGDITPISAPTPTPIIATNPLRMDSDAYVWKYRANFTNPNIGSDTPSMVTHSHELWAAEVPGGLKADWDFWTFYEGFVYIDVAAGGQYNIGIVTTHEFGSPTKRIETIRVLTRRLSRNEVATISLADFFSVSQVSIGAFGSISISQDDLDNPSSIKQELRITREDNAASVIQSLSISQGEAYFRQFGAVKGESGSGGNGVSPSAITDAIQSHTDMENAHRDDAMVGDAAFSNPPSDLSDDEKMAVLDAIGAGTGSGISDDQIARLLPVIPSDIETDGLVPVIRNDVVGWRRPPTGGANPAQVARLLPALPATGSRAGKIARFVSDTLSWVNLPEAMAGGAASPVFKRAVVTVPSGQGVDTGLTWSALGIPSSTAAVNARGFIIELGVTSSFNLFGLQRFMMIDRERIAQGTVASPPSASAMSITAPDGEELYKVYVENYADAGKWYISGNSGYTVLFIRAITVDRGF